MEKMSEADNNCTYHLEYNLSCSKKAINAIVPKISSTLSILGSSYIIFHSLQRLLKNRNSIIGGRESCIRQRHRLLIALSICDIIGSSCYFISTWAIPKDDEQNMVVFNVGNQTTCTAQGFLIQFGTISVAFYNASLSVYFYLSVRYGMAQNKTLRNVSEVFFHVTSIGFSFIISVIGLRGEFYNPTPALCWIAENPRNCTGDDCIRGKNQGSLRIFGFMIPIVICITIIITSMCLLYTTVRRQEDIARSYSRRWSQNRSDQNRANSYKVYRQALRYIAAFSTTWVPTIFHTVFSRILISNTTFLFASGLLLLICGPLQGFFNCMVYIRNTPIERLVRRMSRVSRISEPEG